MAINWDEVQRELSPIKDVEDLCKRLHQSLSFSLVCNTYNFTMPELIRYTQKLLGGDARGRYTEYAARLIGILTSLQIAGVQTVSDLHARTASREQMEIFTEQSKVPGLDTIAVLKYLIYWFIPGEKYLSGLVREDPEINRAIKVLGEKGIRTNLELLEKGYTARGRQSLVETSGLPAEIISELVNRSDFSRLPWASKATISNIIGAGYGSLDQLAKADPEKLYADFFNYGKAIGKNLKLGNEIENSYRIARIIPALLQ
jgi:hypothetical protein